MDASADGAHVTKIHTKGMLTCAILTLSLLGTASANAAFDKGHGPDGLGKEGVEALLHGDVTRADREFFEEYQAHPANPLAQFNMADSLRQHGEIDRADMLYGQAAASGKEYIPDHLLEAHDATTTVRDVACRHLAEDRKADPNCPSLRVELERETVVAAAPPAPPPPPAPYVEPAPPPPPAAAVVPAREFMVFFDFDKSNLTTEAREVVSAAVRTAKERGAVRIVVTGHTDTVGSLRYNQGLSERRANSVKAEMVKQGMDGTMIATVGKSFTDPLIQTGPGVREPQNRRAVIDIGGGAVASAE